MDLYGRLLGNVLYPGWERLRGRDPHTVGRLLERTQHASAAELADLQSGLLRRLVRHAHAHCRYYRDQWDAAGVRPEDIKDVRDLARRRSYDAGEPARLGVAYDDRLLMITGPLALVKKGRGLRIENGALTGDDPPTAARVDSWIAQGIHVAGRPDWLFVKVHTHGALEQTTASLLGADGQALHAHLTERYNDGARWRLHYVTAREMYNVARAAMDGLAGDPGRWRDYVVPPPPIAS